MNKVKEPPLALVKTWYQLLNQTDCKDGQKRGQSMLLGAFGNEEAVAEYLRKHNIIE